MGLSEFSEFMSNENATQCNTVPHVGGRLRHEVAGMDPEPIRVSHIALSLVEIRGSVLEAHPITGAQQPASCSSEGWSRPWHLADS